MYLVANTRENEKVEAAAWPSDEDSLHGVLERISQLLERAREHRRDLRRLLI